MKRSTAAQTKNNKDRTTTSLLRFDLVIMFGCCVNTKNNVPDLKKTIKEQDWEETTCILEDSSRSLVQDQLSGDEFDILWHNAPLETIKALLEVWPDAHKSKSRRYKDLVGVKLHEKQWDFLDKIAQEFPQVLERKYLSTAAKYEAPHEFLDKHWGETGALLYSIYNKDWEKFGEILMEYPQLAKEELSRNEFTILWWDGNLDTIQSLLKAWPEAYKQQDHAFRNLVEVKVYENEWNFLRSIICAFPDFVTAVNVENVLGWFKLTPPLDIFELMLDKQPNAPLEYPYITFELITLNKLDHFCAVVERCPGATELKEEDLHLTPLLIMFQEKEKINSEWIGPILKANPNTAMEKDFDGKTPLHLSYQHGASSELIDMIRESHPEAESIRDNLGRFPKDLANHSEKTIFTAADETLILMDNSIIEKSYPENAVVLCRGDMLIRDPQTAQNKEDKKTYVEYSEHVFARYQIFGTLLDEFSKMVGVDNKDVIQKAAAIQALAVQYLSNQNDTIINFGSFDNPGYWYQQEVLKLVMGVYHETIYGSYSPFHSIMQVADFCIEYLEDRENGKPLPKPSEYFEAYDELTRWLTEGLFEFFYSVQGPVLKPLQSLFNKLFIRRGQTSVHVISDIARGTLLVKNRSALQKIVERIKNTFPNITEDQFRHPDKFDGLADFLTYVHNDFNFIPDSDNVLPYRFKANSSQKNKDKPLWYNLNFFLQMPEYHRVGFSEMFVACELQIGLAEEINKHRQTHVAYERDRILLSQPLLKNYNAFTKEEEGEDRSLQISNCTEEDNKLIEKVLFGEIATDVLVPCTTAGTDNNMLLFKDGLFSLSSDAVEDGSFVKPEQFCLNSRSLNWHALDCPKKDSDGCTCMAFRAAGPYKLDGTKRYFVESFVLGNIYSGGFGGAVGLYAHVGPYLIQIACSEVMWESEDIVVVESGQNLSHLEQMCPVPAGTIALEVIFHGREADGGGEFGYDELQLSLQVFDVY